VWAHDGERGMGASEKGMSWDFFPEKKTIACWEIIRLFCNNYFHEEGR